MQHVLRLAAAKALAISGRQSDAWVLGADTIVTIDGEVLGKPRTPAESRQMLGKLSGREHAVYTGFALCRGNEVHVRDVRRSIVCFKSLSPAEMAWYSALAEPYDKAGGYAVQGTSACFIREIHGSYTNVMGLPLCEVMEALTAVGAISF